MCVCVCVCNGCMPVRAVCKPHYPDLKKRRLLGRAPASRAGIQGSRPARCDGADPGGVTCACASVRERERVTVHCRVFVCLCVRALV